MSKVAIVQFDDRSRELLGPYNELLERNRQYAQNRGYHYEFTRSPERDVPAHWNKVYLVSRFLRAGFDTVAWLDSDAVIHDFDTPVEAMFEGNAGFVFSSDLPIWKPCSPFNAGVFFCRGEFGRTLMDEWQSLYPAAAWQRKGGKWNFEDHVWAGKTFEQGCFADALFPKYAKHSAFKQLPWQRLQSPYLRPESFSLHFPNKLRMNTLLYLNELADLASPGAALASR